MKNLQLILLVLFSAVLFAQEKTESPYLKVLTPNTTIPLKATKAKVIISGTIAHVHIQQIYQNTGQEAIEAEYVFPMSTQAAVHAMKMTIGKRVVHAKIYEKKKAERVYNKAIQEGKRASKLVQSRPNIFQMNVGNIMPNDEITIDINYTEMLNPFNGEYSFVFPGVVGPRYTGENNSGEKTFYQPYTSKGINDNFNFDIDVRINAGMTIQQLSSQTHDIAVDYQDQCSAKITLTKANKTPSNRDYILNYTLRGETIETGLLLYEHEDEKFFSYTMLPPKKGKANKILPREYLFIVDVSGSMMGYPLDVSKKLMRNLLGNLNEHDRFNVLLFASESTVFKSNSVIANEKNINDAFAFFHDNHSNGGGTLLINALKRAYNLPRFDENSARSMVIITDGYVSVEKDAFSLIESNLNQASVFTFGIGSSVNRYLIEGMAKVSHAESFIATNEQEAYKMASKFKKYIENPILTQIKFNTKDFEVYDVEPKAIPDVFASRPITIYGKWKGEPTGKIIIKGKQGSKRFKETIIVSKDLVNNENEALRYLWARKKIERLDDYKKAFDADVKQEVIELGIQYNLVTNYTSFVAVDDQVVHQNKSLKKVKQPLSLPKNVENSAIGAEAEVKAKSIFKKGFFTTFHTQKQLTKAIKRQLKMWIRTKYSKTINAYLQRYAEIQLEFNALGTLVGIKGLENGIWTNITMTLETNLLQLDKKIKVGQALQIQLKR